MTNFNPSTIDWSNARFAIVSPSGNIGYAQTFVNMGQLAIQLDWRVTPSDEDIAFSEEAIKVLLPSTVNDVVSCRSIDKEDSDRKVKQYLNASNN